jgi:hypothetical protein
MVYSIILSFLGEGTTDHRFLPNITERLIQECLLEQNKEATIQWLPITKFGNNAVEIIVNAARQSNYCTALILHSDSDNRNPDFAYNTKIKPGIDAIHLIDEYICKNVIVVIPITETEAWMLVDKELLKEEMNTNLSNHKLRLDYPLKNIERIADPKRRISDAIEVHHKNLNRKRRKNAVKISELYEPISRQVELTKLEVLNAYLKFKENVINSLKEANVLD